MRRNGKDRRKKRGKKKDKKGNNKDRRRRRPETLGRFSLSPSVSEELDKSRAFTEHRKSEAGNGNCVIKAAVNPAFAFSPSFLQEKFVGAVLPLAQTAIGAATSKGGSKGGNPEEKAKKKANEDAKESNEKRRKEAREAMKEVEKRQKEAKKQHLKSQAHFGAASAKRVVV